MKRPTSFTLAVPNSFQHHSAMPNTKGKRLQRYLGLSIATAILPWTNLARSQQPEAAVSAPIWAEIMVRGSVPAHIRPTGEHGTVILEGDVASDGKISTLVVTKSSGSPALDAYARDSVDGQSMPSDEMKKSPSRARLTVEIYNPSSKELLSNMGASLSCEQAVVDADWYARTFPDAGVEQTPQYLWIRFSYTSTKRPELAFAADRTNFDRIWKAAIESCRATPASSFFATLITASRR